ncbi:hypothetical protein ACJMK2_016871 [Sinanodonta woodiana]|uniref:RING-type domain-containing protein n=1 Tax=Sinanodonta woodiana TaxID=1069815 RepID=A0ABD3UYK6_SINWO
MAEAEDSGNKPPRCPICSKTFKSPKSIPCMHSFCEKCICKYVKDLIKDETQPETVQCPVCRMHFLYPTEKISPEEWAAILPNNLVLLSGSTSNQEDQDVPMFCEPCIEVGMNHVSVAFCVTCSEYLCDICYGCHKRYKAIRGHQITVHAAVQAPILNPTRCKKKKKK